MIAPANPRPDGVPRFLPLDNTSVWAEPVTVLCGACQLPVYNGGGVQAFLPTAGTIVKIPAIIHRACWKGDR